MSKSKDVHVIPHDGKWATKTTGSTKVGKTFDRQADAMISGIQQAKNNQAELLVHGKNGQIRLRNTYKDDPYPPKG